MTTPEFPVGPFATIVADPPWQFSNRSSNGAAENHYPTMTEREILRLPVEEIAAENAHLYLWVTDSHLPLGLKVMEQWGFSYRQVLTWRKVKDGSLQMGPGNYWRHCTEHCLFGIRGKAPVTDHAVLACFDAARGEHSGKPDLFFDLVQKVSGGPFLEMFARKPRGGWVVWGNEIPGGSVSTVAVTEATPQQAPVTAPSAEAPAISVEQVTPPKRGRGRPRKHPLAPVAAPTVPQAVVVQHFEKTETLVQICGRCKVEFGNGAARCPKCGLTCGACAKCENLHDGDCVAAPVQGLDSATTTTPNGYILAAQGKINEYYMVPDSRALRLDGSSKSFIFFRGTKDQEFVRCTDTDLILPTSKDAAMKCPACEELIAVEAITAETTACPFCKAGSSEAA